MKFEELGMEVIAQLGSLLGLSFISGINLYATVAVVGICTKYHLVAGLPPEFNILAHDAVIFVALLLYALEFLIDKVPWLDTLWDSIHTLIRPLGGAMLALIQVGEASPALEVIVFMLGASLASVAHITKAGTRLIINSSPEPFSNILVSLGEDVGTIGFAYLSLAYPKTSFFLTSIILVLLGLIFPLILRTVRMLFSALFFRVRCFFHKEAAWIMSRSIPFSVDSALDSKMEQDEKFFWTSRAFAVKVPDVPRFASLQVVITSKGLHLVYKRWFKTHLRMIPLDEVQNYRCYSGALLCKWLVKTSRGDWLLQIYQPLSKTLPYDLTSKAKYHEAS
jgi:hypothetical protein